MSSALSLETTPEFDLLLTDEVDLPATTMAHECDLLNMPRSEDPRYPFHGSLLSCSCFQTLKMFPTLPILDQSGRGYVRQRRLQRHPKYPALGFTVHCKFFHELVDNMQDYSKMIIFLW